MLLKQNLSIALNQQLLNKDITYQLLSILRTAIVQKEIK